MKRGKKDDTIYDTEGKPFVTKSKRLIETEKLNEELSEYQRKKEKPPATPTAAAPPAVETVQTAPKKPKKSKKAKPAVFVEKPFVDDLLVVEEPQTMTKRRSQIGKYIR